MNEKETLRRIIFELGLIIESLEKARRPCAEFRPSLSIDGNQWCALYGKDLQEGIAGFGDSPEEAMIDFDLAWKRKLGDKN